MPWSSDGRCLEVRVVGGRPPSRDPDDITGRTYDPGTFDQYELRLLIRKDERETYTVGDDPAPKLYMTRVAAVEAAEAWKAEDPSRSDVPVEDISV